jgi:hypothetical protein
MVYNGPQRKAHEVTMTTNVLDLLRDTGITAKKASSSKGGEFHSPCPGCGGEDRFHIWPAQNEGEGSWWCRQCDRGGDGIEFLMVYQGRTFPEACAILGRDLPEKEYTPVFRRTVKREPAAFTPSVYRSPESLWKEKAHHFVDWAHGELLADDEQMAWLSDRGIDEDTIKVYMLGWNTGKNGKDLFRPRESWGLPTEIKRNGRKKMLWIPRGIVIPCYIDGELQRIRIRRPKAHLRSVRDPRYYFVPGSAVMPMILGDAEARAWVVVETELDGIMLHQFAGDLAGVIAMGTASSHPDATGHALLRDALVILNALDFDGAGAKAWQWWRTNYPKAERWPVPEGKDPGEAFQAGVDIRAWVLSGLPPAWHVGPTSSGRKSIEGRPTNMVTSSIQEKGGHALPASILELEALLKQYPVRILATENRMAIRKNNSWSNHQVEKRISRLVFHDENCWGHLSDHPEEIIDGGNFL